MSKEPISDALWIKNCQRWRGKALDGDFAHYCNSYDGLPMDETCEEWPCGCNISTLMGWMEKTAGDAV